MTLGQVVRFRQDQSSFDYDYDPFSRRRSSDWISPNAVLRAAHRWRSWLTEDYRTALFRLRSVTIAPARSSNLAGPYTPGASQASPITHSHVWTRNRTLAQL